LQEKKRSFKKKIMAAYNTKELLALPDKEKRLLAKKLWKSLSDNTAVVKEDKELIKLLNKRWEMIETGKTKVYSSEAFWSNIERHRETKK
jgi:putative addiction module component (TIGR02574 family)